MFRNYLKIAFRNIKNHKVYSFINIAGLALGLTFAVLILIYVRYEFSYDRYPQDYDRIFRLTEHLQSPDRGEISTARTPPPWAPSLAEDFPEIESYVRIKTPLVSWLVSREERDMKFHEKGFYFADETVFDFFNLPLIKGDSRTALSSPQTLVLTETTARAFARICYKRDLLLFVPAKDIQRAMLITGSASIAVLIIDFRTIIDISFIHDFFLF